MKSRPRAKAPARKPERAAERAQRSRWGLLGVCFFASGATGLVYEVLWSRHLLVLFGSTTEAVSVVLATFMTGLGLGAHFLGARVDRSPSPLKLYGLFEIGVGVYALLTGPLLALATSLNDRLAGGLEGTPRAALLKIGLSAVALLPPAFLMGGTLPALLRGVSRSRDEARRLVGVLYGLNTLGAVAGTAAAGFFLLEVLGLSATMRLAGLLNIGLGSLVISVRRTLEAPRGVDAPAEEPEAGRGVLAALSATAAGRFALLGLFVSGAVTMLYEVVFTRVLGLVFGVSSYAFTMVLVVFLLGLAIGAWIQTAVSRRVPVHLAQFAGLQMAVALLGTAALLLIPSVPRMVLTARQTPGMSFTQALVVKAGVAAAFVLPLALVAGVGLPLLLAVLSEDLRRLGRVIGNATMVNTAGTVTGSLVTGFLLVPLLGTEAALRIAAIVSGLTGLAGLWLAGTARGARRWGAVLAAAVSVLVVAAPRWPTTLFLVSDSGGLGVAQKKLDLELMLRAQFQETLFFREGRNATVAVTRTPRNRVLLVSGHPDASDGADMPTQTLLGILPVAAHPHPEDILVVGFGSGVSAEVVARLPEVKSVDIVELERAVLDAAPYFSHVNFGVEKNRKVRLILADARSFVRSSARRYDAIVSEPSNPWRAGVANVFTADFFRSARGVLKPGGLFAQWVQLYDIDDASLRLVFRTFASVFPEVQVWFLDRGNLVVLGSEKPIALSLERVEKLLTGPYAVESERYGRLGRSGELFGRYLLGTRALRDFAGSGPVHTDDEPLLEFEAPRGVFRSDGRNAQRLLAAKRASGELSAPAIGARPDDASLWLGVAEMYRGINEANEARAAFSRADLVGTNLEVFVRAAGAEIEGQRLDIAEKVLTAALPLVPPAGVTDPRLRRDLAYVRARVAVNRGRLDEALVAYQETGEMDGPAGVESLRTLLSLGRKKEALALAERLLSRARIGSILGADAVFDIQIALLRFGDDREGAAAAAGLVARLPGSAEFSRTGRLQTLCVLYSAAGDAPKALAVGEEYVRLGGLEPLALAAYARALDTAGRSAEARRLVGLLKELDEPFR